jgi:prevent-host-death family protein
VTSIGVRDLKAHLSEYLQAASRGETVVVTRHGADFVIIRAASGENEGLRALLESPRVRWSGRRPPVPAEPWVTKRGRALSSSLSRLRERQP